MKYLFSASSMERATACAASTALPRVVLSSDDARRGQAMHRYATRVLLGMTETEALKLVPAPWREACKGLRLHREIALLGLRDLRADQSYAINATSLIVRTLGSGLERAYRVEDGEIPGTDDLEGQTFLGYSAVIDFKFGYQEVTPPAENLQLLFYAYCVARRNGDDRVDGYIGHARKSGHIHWYKHTFTSFDFDVFEDVFSRAYERSMQAVADLDAGKRLPVYPGDHCQFCPAMSACPAYTSLARSMVVDLEEIDRSVEAMTPEQKGAAYEKLAIVKRLAGRIDDALKAQARQTPFVTPSGKEVREMSFDRTDFSQDKALRLLRDLGATDDQIQACHVTSTVHQVRPLKPRAA